MAFQEVSLDDIISICHTLELVVDKSFGPNALSTLLCTSSGKVMVTNSGMTVLQSLNVSHPIGKLITESIQSHHILTGDGIKTFIFVLAEILRQVNSAVNKFAIGDVQRGYSRKLLHVSAAFNKIALEILPKILHHLPCSTTVNCLQDLLPGQLYETMHNIISTVLSTKQSKIVRNHFAEILCKLLSSIPPSELLQMVTSSIKDFHLIAIESSGQLPLSSKVIDGIVIQRDILSFVSPVMPMKDVKFVLIGCSLEEDEDSDDLPFSTPAYISVKTTEQFGKLLEFKSSKVSAIVSLLKMKEITLVLSTHHVHDLTTHLCRQAGITVTAMVTEEELNRLAQVAGVHIVREIKDLFVSVLPHIGHSESCQSLVLGGQRCVYLTGIEAQDTKHASTFVLAKQLVVCAPTSGMCQQYSASLVSALKAVSLWLDPHKVCSSLYTKESSPLRASESRTVLNLVQKETDLAESKSVNRRQCCTNINPTADIPVFSYCGSFNGMYGVLIQGGGAFELALSRALKSKAESLGDHALSSTCTILSRALLSVPIKLVQNSFSCKAHGSATAQLLKLQSYMEARGKAKLTGVNARTGAGLLQDPRVVEPLAGKILLMMHILQLVQQLLRIDAVVAVGTPQTDPSSSPQLLK